MGIQSPGEVSKRLLLLFAAAGILLNASGLFNGILEPDSALYAGIAKRIASQNDWINLYADGGDWLDKPHFPFWMAAISFKFLGISSFSYKFPAFIFWIIGICYTYLLARCLYNINAAFITVIIYISATHVILSNFDVRAEPYLSALVTASVYYLYKLQDKTKFWYCLAAAFTAACAVMTKGIFILITIGGGFIIYWVITKQWKQFIHYKWWMFVALTFIFILPELYCLYMQFDMYPEKIVFGKTNVSGIRFFFWDSQFGRFFNTGPIKGTGDISFYLHTILWAFLPWSVLLYVTLATFLRKKNRITQPLQWIIYGSAGITFLLFSFSRFQLPHYIIIIFPQCAMMVASYLERSAGYPKVMRNIIILQSALIAAATIFIILLIVYCDFGYNYLWMLLVIPAAIISITFTWRKPVKTILYRGFMFAAILFCFLNLYFYPHLLHYQSGMQAAIWLREQKYAGRIAMYKNYSQSLEFYANGNVDRIPDDSSLQHYVSGQDAVIYTSEKNLAAFEKSGYSVNVLHTFDFFHVSMLDLKFINHSTRSGELEKIALISLRKK